MATALVTGGTGFLGSHIVRVLCEAGHRVRILRRASSPLELVGHLPVEHAMGDIMDMRSLQTAMDGCDWVFHVAATSDYWRSNRTRLYLINVNGTTNVLEAAQQTGVQRVIFTSSGAAVGMLDDRASDESVPFNLPPHEFAYGHSKWLAEQEAWKAVERGLDVVTLNPAIVFGPGDINQISGSAVVELSRGLVPVYPVGGATVIDVRDVATMHLLAAQRGRSGERYILGNESLTHRDMLNMTADIVGVAAPKIPVPKAVIPLLATAASVLSRVGVSLPINADQIRLSACKVYFDCRKAWDAFGKPGIPVRQSLHDTYEWYVAHGMIQRRAK